MQDSAFTEAVFRAHHRVCGRRLRPFCAAYAAALEGVGSPLMSLAEGAIITPEDLLYALEICSSVVARDTMMPAAVMAPHSRWLDLYRRVVWRFRPARFRAALEQWLRYYEDDVSMPQLMERCDSDEAGDHSRAGGGTTGPLQLARVCSLLKQYPSISEYRAWTMPYGYAAWLDAQGRELDGGSQFWSAERDAEVEAQLAAAEAKGRELLAERKRRQRRA
ncbi:hypothetical protein QEH52_01790 [Coraliomargarita sp. SDUM461003]|uniref:Uncharacterized protein n=1 Tax=Thalassobacterium maritimum TaxID=3041265 RepID=A0ABU1APY3_9BACT|nr:hypothetical protein [Coraliomargarita sp. SDUM461003]MDQ8206224.1 hypothetical protein [Coraliomargarita sp. SDUM461003]